MRESASSSGFWVSSYAPFGYNRVMVQDGPKKRPTLQIDPDASRIVKRIFDMAEAGNGTLEIIQHPQRRGHPPAPGESSGPRPASTTSSSTSPTRGHWSGARTQRTRPSQCGWRRRSPPSSPRPSSSSLSSKPDAPARPSSVPSPQGRKHLLCSAAWSSATRARGRSAGRFAKSGQYSYYVCQSIMKRGKDACNTPRLNARRFEELVVAKIRSNILTEGEHHVNS